MDLSVFTLNIYPSFTPYFPMNLLRFIVLAYCFLLTSYAYAETVTIADFDEYTDTTAMQADVSTFGPAEQIGLPELAQGSGIDESNAVYLQLSWKDGDNANLSLRNFDSAVSSIKSGSSIQLSIYLETADGNSAAATPTSVKLAIEGTNGTIWQTKGSAAVQPTLGEFYELAFNVSSDDMERVTAADDSFTETIEAIESIRFRFENDVQADVVENLSLIHI